MKNIYLIRHGETDWNKKGKIQGSLDIEMNDIGKRQIYSLLREIPKFSKKDTILLSSDMKRCKQACEIISTALNITPLFSEFLREVDFGSWSGRYSSEMEDSPEDRKAWSDLNPFHKWNGGESIYEAHTRANNYVSSYLNISHLKNILIVSHGLIIQSLINNWVSRNLSGLSKFDVSNGSLSIIEYLGDGKSKLILLNNTPIV